MVERIGVGTGIKEQLYKVCVSVCGSQMQRSVLKNGDKQHPLKVRHVRERVNEPQPSSFGSHWLPERGGACQRRRSLEKA